MMVEVAIVGAGLSGLALAVALQAEGRRVAVLEARDRPGGRVLSEVGYDLGPAWIWPHNRRMLALIDDLGLRRFPQHSSASPLDSAEGALFGFAIPGASRQPEFRAAALAQLGRLFGPEAARPTDVLIKDWSHDPHTATERDQAPPGTHPAYPPQPSTPRILFAGSEAARTEGGFLEGALEAAEAAQHALAKAAA